MVSNARRPAVVSDQPNLAVVAETAGIEAQTADLAVEREVVVRLLPPMRWVAAEMVYLGPAEPRIVLDIAAWDEE